MVQILHISDPHADTRTMNRLEEEVPEYPLAIIAVTGDCKNCSGGRLPRSWSDWPQLMKLAVPGNRDAPDTFADLASWTVGAPWTRCYDDLLVLGLNTEAGARELPSQLNYLIRRGIPEHRGVVVLAHRWLGEIHLPPYVSSLLEHFIQRLQGPLLVLHGHSHKHLVEGVRWYPEADLLGRRVSRSHVYSAAPDRHGAFALINWDGTSFSIAEAPGETGIPANFVA